MSKMVRMPDGRPMSMGDLPASAFPLTVEGFLTTALGTRELLWTRTVEPYTVVDIPSAGEYMGHVAVKVTFADGSVIWQEPMTRTEAQAYIDRRLAETD